MKPRMLVLPCTVLALAASFGATFAQELPAGSERGRIGASSWIFRRSILPLCSYEQEVSTVPDGADPGLGEWRATSLDGKSAPNLENRDGKTRVVDEKWLHVPWDAGRNQRFYTADMHFPSGSALYESWGIICARNPNSERDTVESGSVEGRRSVAAAVAAAAAKPSHKVYVGILAHVHGGHVQHVRRA